MGSIPKSVSIRRSVSAVATTVSMNKPLFTGIYLAQSDWAPLLFRPPQTKGFSLPFFLPMPIGNQTALFTDRPRWMENRIAPTVEEKAEKKSEDSEE